MKAHIFITLKSGVLDPQGAAVTRALKSLHYEAVEDVRQGKYFELTLNSTSRTKAEAQVKEMCEKLLANTVIEDYRFEIVDR